VSVSTPPQPPSTQPLPDPALQGNDPDLLIKEARERQRRRRRWIALTLAVIAAASAIGYGVDHGGGSHPSATARGGSGSGSPSSPKQRQQQLARAASKTTIGDSGLIAPGVGWAMNGSALWLTTNDGRNWQTITPPALRGQDVIARVGDVDFLDARHGWVSAELNGRISVNGSLRYGGISITADGGKSWHLVTLPGCYQCANTHLSFLNARHGYAIAAGQSTHAAFIERLYVTSDGGYRWRLVRPLSFRGRMIFTDARHGWVISDPTGWKQTRCCATPIGGEIAYRTSDGGHTWQRVVPPTPAAYAGEREDAVWMRFFDTRHGLVASLVLDRATKRLRVLVDVTNDGGTTWTVRAAPLSSEQPRTQDGTPYAPFSAASTQDWMLFSRTRPILFRTGDGGRSWRTVATTPNPRPASVWGPDFVTVDEGWAVFLAGNSRAALVRTTDGGRTWTPLTPPMPKEPPAPAPAPACGSACQRP
jgi:photosystem II stability/assembly factor-like uncharacterized protein